jgi:Reverse transcriptase (RNA-dependent DNA polymerase)
LEEVHYETTVPTVSDRIAQMVVKSRLEPEIDPLFHPDSYGYRPGKSALDAVGQARQRCWQFDWVIDLDIKGFFDNLDHELLMRAVRKHAKDPWAVLYISRWLTAPAQDEEGRLTERGKGTPQGGVISPLLANLFQNRRKDCAVPVHVYEPGSGGPAETDQLAADIGGTTHKRRHNGCRTMGHSDVPRLREMEAGTPDVQVTAEMALCA